MKEQIIDKFVGFLLVFLILFAIFLQISTTRNTDKLKNDELVKSEQYAQKIVRLITLRTGGALEQTLKLNLDERVKLNEILEAFLTKQFRYIFVLAKDKDDHYRFVLDGEKENPEALGNIFFPKSDLFNEVYETGKLQIIEQKDEVEGVWVSLVYPYKENGKTTALLVLDLSKEYAKYLNEFNSPLLTLVRIMQIFLFLALLVLILIGYRYYKTRQALIHDSLTNAYTKYYLTEFFDRNLVSKYYLFLIDIDEFKEFNAKYGNHFGDLLIQSFVTRIYDILGKESKVIRTVGTEFIVVYPKNESDNLIDLAENLFQVIGQKRYFIEEEMVRLYVSMSAINTPDEAHSIQHVLRLLDETLLKVKSQGKNALSILGVSSYEKIKYNDIDYIKEALEEERLVCLYQPIYDTKSKTIVKYEALARLVDKEDKTKLISPFQFMQLIKGTSQYIKMSKLVLSGVFKTLEAYPKIEISMNLDLDDLYNVDMMKLINDYLVKYQEDAPRLTFEILEDNEIEDYERVSEIFKALKEYGSKIAIDDFGSGYANYKYLICLDIDILKIDGTLIRELETHKEHATIVLKSIKNLAETFDYMLVAEFVSNETIYNRVKDLGIGYSQGMYLGEPRPLNEYLT